MAGLGIDEAKRSLKHAHYAAGAKYAIVALDFHMFNAYREEVIDKNIVVNFDETNLIQSESNSCLRIYGRQIGLLAFSGAALRESLNTVQQQDPPPNVLYLSNGRRDTTFMDDYVLKSHRPQSPGFLGQAHGYMDTVWFPRSSDRFCYQTDTQSIDTIEDVREMVAFGRQTGMKLYFVLTPEHAFLQLAIRHVGLWWLYERLRQDLVNVLSDDAAAHPGDEAYPLWDFATLNSITTEPRPPASVPASDQHMKWWYEPTHSQSAVGDLIVQQMFDYPDGARAKAIDFGTKLDRSNIDAHLRRLQVDIERYAASHPGEVAEIVNLARTIPRRQDSREYCKDDERPKQPRGSAPVVASRQPLTRTDPIAAAAFQQSADALRAKGANVEALRAYDEAIRVSAPNTALHFLRGTLRLEMSDFGGAIRDFETGLRFEPENRTLQELLARARAALANVGLDPAAAVKHQQRADELRAAGDLAGAIKDYTEAIRVGPPNAALHFLRGTARLEVGDKAGAAQDFERGLTLDPTNTTLQQLLEKSLSP